MRTVTGWMFVGVVSAGCSGQVSSLGSGERGASGDAGGSPTKPDATTATYDGGGVTHDGGSSTYDGEGMEAGTALDAKTTADDGPPVSCDLPGRTIDVNGYPGYVLNDIQGIACAGTFTCNAAVAHPPYCGDEGAALDGYACTCASGSLHCVLTAQGGGIALPTWCDGGPGTDDAGRAFTIDGGPCTAAVGSFPSPTCDTSDDNAAACRTGTTNNCTYAAKCGSTSTCEPFTTNPAPATGVDHFRIRYLDVVAPPALATPTVQKVIITSAIDLPDKGDGGAACGEDGTGLFNWLLSVDRVGGTATTGGAPRSNDPFGAGYCYLHASVGGQFAEPATAAATFTGSTFSSTPVDGVLELPIFLEPSGSLVLPLRDVAFHDVSVSDDGNCIGAINISANTQSHCSAAPSTTGASSCARWHGGGAVTGYIRLDEADKVLFSPFNTSLCAFLTGDATTASPSTCTAAGLVAGNYCSTTSAPGGCRDSVWFAATFAASAVRLAPSSFDPLCQVDGG